MNRLLLGYARLGSIMFLLATDAAALVLQTLGKSNWILFLLLASSSLSIYALLRSFPAVPAATPGIRSAGARAGPDDPPTPTLRIT